MAMGRLTVTWDVFKLNNVELLGSIFPRLTVTWDVFKQGFNVGIRDDMAINRNMGCI